MDIARRQLGATNIEVSTVALGCWPMAGMTSPDVVESEALAAIEKCFDIGVNFLDTAYCYGANGESEKLIRRAIGNRRNEVVIATKGGIHWSPAGEQMRDASPKRIRWECEQSLSRLGVDHVELYYLHAPDHTTPVAETAGEMRKILDEGKARSIGVSNATVAQLDEFQAICPIAAVQPPYNMLQREIEADIVPWCIKHQVSLCVYWPLLKGLFGGKMGKDHQFPKGDGRAKYPMFQGDEFQKNFDFTEKLKAIAARKGRSAAELAVAWVIAQPGITSALCGAKRPDQITETAKAMSWQLSEEELAEINRAVTERGAAAMRSPVRS